MAERRGLEQVLDLAAGERADDAPTYDAAFLRDPGGNNVEAACLAP